MDCYFKRFLASVFTHDLMLFCLSLSCITALSAVCARVFEYVIVFKSQIFWVEL